MCTTVTNLRTGKELTYTSPPAEAVQAAREQEKGNWQTWAYPCVLQNPEVVFGRFTVSCGDWCALLPQENLNKETH